MIEVKEFVGGILDDDALVDARERIVFHSLVLPPMRFQFLNKISGVFSLQCEA